ncbi:hypothetical protein Tco_1114945 [Tanacetum coccineum]
MLSGSVFSKQYFMSLDVQSSKLEDNKLKKLSTSLLMKALKLSNSQNLQLMISSLLNYKYTHLMNIFITLNLLKVDVSLDQNDQGYQIDQVNQNDHPIQTNEILNDDQPKHSYHNNDEHIIDNLTNTKDVQITKPPSSLIEDASAPNAILIIQAVSPLSIPSIATSAPQDRWSREKHIELVNIVGNPRTGILTREINKELSAALAHECLFV